MFRWEQRIFRYFKRNENEIRKKRLKKMLNEEYYEKMIEYSQHFKETREYFIEEWKNMIEQI